MKIRRDISGQRFGKLLVSDLSQIKIASSGAGKRYWLCHCDCGTKKWIRGTSLTYKSGVRSCGCGLVDWHKSRDHGAAKHVHYKRWTSMIQRCHNPNEPSFKHYGGRGIEVCEKWRRSFWSFVDDMGGYEPGMTLDRINNDGDYEPQNCKWASPHDQSRNKRVNRVAYFRGSRFVATDLAIKIGCSQATAARWARIGQNVDSFAEVYLARKTKAGE